MARTVVGADRLSCVWAAILCGTVLASVPASGHADQGAPVVLSWQTPPDAPCATGEEIRERVARLTGRPLALIASTGGYRIEAIVSSNGPTWQAVVTLLDGAGRPTTVRTVEGRTPSCGSVDVAAAVVIATMLDGLPVQAPAREVPAAHAASDGGEMQLGAFVAASPGLIPRAWFGGGIEVQFGSAIAILVEATVYAPAEQADSLARGARLWGFHGGGGVCPRLFAAGQLDLRLCATIQAGVLFARGIGLTANADSNLPILLLKLGPKLRFEVTELVSAELGMSAAWVIVRSRVHWEIEGEPRRELRSDLIVLLAQIGFVISME